MDEHAAVRRAGLARVVSVCVSAASVVEAARES